MITVLTLCASLVSAISAVYIFSTFRIIADDDLSDAFLAFWGGDWAGAMICGSFLLLYVSWANGEFKGIKNTELGDARSNLLIGVICGLFVALMLGLNFIFENRYDLMVLTIVPVCVTAILHGIGGGLVSALVTAIVFVGADRVLGVDGDSTIQLQFLIVTVFTLALLAGSIKLERDMNYQRALDSEKRAASRLSDVILQSAGEGIYGLDSEGKATFINSAACKVLGYRPDDLVGTVIHDVIHHTHADGRPFPRSECRIYRAFDENQQYSVDNEFFWKKDGSKFPVKYVATPMVSQDATVGPVVVFSDITELVNAEQARDREKIRAEEANVAKSHFLSSMSHEFRTPLNAISGYAQMIGGEIAGPLGHARYREYAEAIQLASNHLSSLVNDMLDLGKIESGNFEMDLQPVRLEPVVQSAVMIVKEAFPKGCRNITISMDDDGLTVVADERSLHQVLLNLLSNATKNTHEDGVIAIDASASSGNDAAASSVKDASTSSERSVKIRICDTGVGIPEEKLDLVFGAFIQVPRDPMVSAPGTGLGLGIAKKLTELQGGKLYLESEVGVGTTAFVELKSPEFSESR